MNTSIHQINRLTSASQDLENCLRFLGELEYHTYGSTPHEALLLSAILFYARPFSQNEKRNSLHPSESRVSDSVISRLSKDEMTLHERIITLRNKAVAHAEWSHHPTGVSEDGIIRAMPFSIWKHFQGSNILNQFQQLSRNVSTGVKML